MTKEEIRKICDLYRESMAEVNKKYQGGIQYNPYLDKLMSIALSNQEEASNYLHNEITELVIKKL